jgi:formiminotetrahydrofolate cyclodeaminase
MKLSALPLSDLLAAFRSPEPVPGGGAAAALAGAVGASLLAMVAGLAHPRAATAEDGVRLTAAGARCAALGEQLSLLIDLDSESYGRVLAAYRLPRETGEEQTARTAGIQEALRGAAAAALQVMRACGDAIEQGAVVAAFGNPHAASDAQVALELLGAGLRGAKLTVDVNLAGIEDARFIASASEEARRRAGEAETGIAAARARLDER